jgi:hypothetical protein
MIERIPAQFVYKCDRCKIQETVSEEEDIERKQALTKWVTISIVSLLPPLNQPTRKMSRDTLLCGRCVRELGQPIDEDPRPAKNSSTTKSPHAELLELLEAPPRPTTSST